MQEFTAGGFVVGRQNLRACLVKITVGEGKQNTCRFNLTRQGSGETGLHMGHSVFAKNRWSTQWLGILSTLADIYMEKKQNESHLTGEVLRSEEPGSCLLCSFISFFCEGLLLWVPVAAPAPAPWACRVPGYLYCAKGSAVPPSTHHAWTAPPLL